MIPPKANRFELAGAWLGRGIGARPRLTVALCLGACLLGLVGLLRAQFSTDYRIFFSKEDPGLASFEHLEKVFTKTDNVLFVLTAPVGQSIFSFDGLSAVDELTQASWKLPFASRADSITNFPFAHSEGDDIAVQTLLESHGALDDAELQRLRARALGEPILVGSLLSPDGRTAAVNVTLRLPRVDPTEVPQTTAAARALVEQLKAAHPQLDVRATGMAFVNDAFMQTSIQDMSVMMPIMLLVMLVSMSVLVRSALATLAVASVVALSAGLSMAMAGWLGYPLSPTSVAAPMIVLTVAIADGVHMVLSTLEHLRAGRSKREAIAAALTGNLEAVTYTWLTTVVGFLCLNSSDAPPVLHLANMSSLGVTAAFVLSITLLPALLVVLPLRLPKASAAHAHDGYGRLSTFVVRHRRAVLACAAVLTVGAGAVASRLETNDEFIHYFDASLPFRRDVDFAMARLPGMYRLEFQLGAGAKQGATTPDYLAHLDAFARWLRAQPEVRHTYGLHDVISSVHQLTHHARPGTLPLTKEDAAEALLLYSLNLPAGLDLGDRITLDQSASRLTVIVNDLSTRHMNDFSNRAEAWLRANAPPAMWARPTGPVVIFSALSERNARGMLQGDLLSLVLISLCMVLVLRSVKLGLLSVIPNVIPIVVGYGLWWCVVGELNIVATIAGSISLGIIVDDTIHFLTRYRATLASDLSLTPEAALRTTLSHVGPAMVSTTVVLVLGFGVLTLSHFQMTSHLGWLSVLIVGIAPIADLVVAPALIVTLLGRRAPKPAPQFLLATPPERSPS